MFFHCFFHKCFINGELRSPAPDVSVSSEEVVTVVTFTKELLELLLFVLCDSLKTNREIQRDFKAQDLWYLWSEKGPRVQGQSSLHHRDTMAECMVNQTDVLTFCSSRG